MEKHTQETTHFGFEEVPRLEKQKRVKQVFDSVADSYDLMNHLMSLGIHKYWKQQALASLELQPHHCVLDIAGGTGDMSKLIASKLLAQGKVILSDINAEMLRLGRDNMINAGLVAHTQYCLANAEHLPFPDNQFDRVVIAFGLRNVTDKQKALEEMYRILKPGGIVVILEFSHVQHTGLAKIYDWYSFNVLPALGEHVAGDRDSYRYLAESIRRHPKQHVLRKMLEEAGFSHCGYENLLHGVVALHKGTKS